jgi:membrane peptidoglycan carboxypeptidase
MRGKVDVAAKTGTTNDQKDRWFVGYTPYYLAGVWFGYDEPKFLNVNQLRFNPPMLTWNYVMDTIHAPIYDNPKKFERPETVVEALYCLDSGMAQTEACKLDLRGSSRVDVGFFAKGMENEPCNVHVLVDWCTRTSRVASPGCPSDSIEQIALIRDRRNESDFRFSTTGSRYTYRDVPRDYIYPTDSSVPFWANLFPGVHVGSSEEMFSGYCVWHAANPAADVPDEEEVTEPPGEEAQPDNQENPAENNNADITEEPTVPAEIITEPPAEEPEPETLAEEQPDGEPGAYIQPPPHVFEEVTIAPED